MTVRLVVERDDLLLYFSGRDDCVRNFFAVERE